MKPPRIRVLSRLESLKREALESRARDLQKLNAEIAALEAERNNLKEGIRSASSEMSVEAAPFLKAYLTRLRSDMSAVDKRIADLEGLRVGHRKAVRDAFTETKAISHVHQREATAYRDEMERTDAQNALELHLMSSRSRS